MDATTQRASAPGKPVKTVGAIAFGLAVAHSWVAAMHWSDHTVTLEAFGFAAVGIVTPFLIAYAIAGRRIVRDWNRVGLWFLLWAIVIQMVLVHGLGMVGVLPR
ncbi:MAG TPA: hypothetical protein VN946_20085 [Terriglobales bacterium]|jgi:hypothetical protein|nr:hypothetical protein [Terriglobales bacterium]